MDSFHKLVYVSDQLVSFFQQSNLGNGLAFLLPDAPSKALRLDFTKEESFDALKEIVSMQDILSYLQESEHVEYREQNCPPAEIAADFFHSMNVFKSLDLLINKRIATIHILSLLMKLVYLVNQLEQPDCRLVRYNDNMVSHFGPTTNTRYMLEGVDVTPEQHTASEDPTPDRSLSGFARMQSFERIRVRQDDRDFEEGYKTGRKYGTKFVKEFRPYNPQRPDDEWGLWHQSFPKLLEMYCIDDSCVTPLQLKELKSQMVTSFSNPQISHLAMFQRPATRETNPNMEEATFLSVYLEVLVDAHQDHEEPDEPEEQ